MIGATYHHKTFAGPALIRARAVMEKPDMHSHEDVLIACSIARNSSDWAAAERAEQLLQSIRIDAAARDEEREAQIQFWDSAIYGSLAGALAFIGAWGVCVLIRAGGTFMWGM